MMATPIAVVGPRAHRGRLGTGISSDESNGASVSVGTLVGGYLKGAVALAPKFSVYGVVGIASVSLHRNYGDGDATDTGFSIGIGGDCHAVARRLAQLRVDLFAERQRSRQLLRLEPIHGGRELSFLMRRCSFRFLSRDWRRRSGIPASICIANFVRS